MTSGRLRDVPVSKAGIHPNKTRDIVVPIAVVTPPLDSVKSQIDKLRKTWFLTVSPLAWTTRHAWIPRGVYRYAPTPDPKP